MLMPIIGRPQAQPMAGWLPPGPSRFVADAFFAAHLRHRDLSCARGGERACGRFTVSTVDHEWSARIEGTARAVLDGPDGPQRVLRVEMHQAVFDGRYVQARDAEGMVEIRITPRLCLDRASTQYPYTARLSIEGAAPVLGCGRPLP